MLAYFFTGSQLLWAVLIDFFYRLKSPGFRLLRAVFRGFYRLQLMILLRFPLNWFNGSSSLYIFSWIRLPQKGLDSGSGSPTLTITQSLEKHIGLNSVCLKMYFLNMSYHKYGNSLILDEIYFFQCIIKT